MSKSQVVINLDTERVFKLNYNTLCNLEEHGFTLEDISKDGKVSFKALRCLVWSGLVCTYKELTLDEVGDMLDFTNTQEISEAIQKLMTNLQK